MDKLLAAEYAAAVERAVDTLGKIEKLAAEGADIVEAKGSDSPEARDFEARFRAVLEEYHQQCTRLLQFGGAPPPASSSS